MAVNEICRLCLEHATEFFDLFLDQEGSFKINDLLSHYSIIELDQDDEISSKICSKCWSHINDFHDFCIRIQKLQESINSIVYVDTKSDVYEVVLSNACDDDPNDDAEDDNTGNKVDVEIETEELQESTNAIMEEIITCKVEEVCQNQTDIPTPAATVKDTNPVEQLTVFINDGSNVSVVKTESPQTDDKDLTAQRKLKKVRKKSANKEDTHENLINSFFELCCELCQKHFQCYMRLFHHYEGDHKIRGFITCCGVKYFKTTKIAEHVLRHQNPQMFKCTKCDLDTIFSDKKQLEAHMLTHLEPDSNVFQCEKCEKTFIKKYRFDQHMLTHLSPEEKKHVCQDCGKPYATESLLRVHVRVVHLKSYANKCEICSKVFKSRAFFEKHQLEHMGQSLPRIQCQICNTWMKNEHTMRAHRRLHDDEGTVHECDVCGKIGPSRNAILKHKRYVHLSERTFKCSLCPKAFKRAVSLKEHMTIHTGEALYKCTFCAKTFNSKANMFSHKKKWHFKEWKTEKENSNK